jgi:hypothetical protein
VLLDLHPDVRVGGATISLSGGALACKTQALAMLLDAGVDIEDVTRQRLSLEEVYLQAVRA